jgi:hypothetical protein
MNSKMTLGRLHAVGLLRAARMCTAVLCVAAIVLGNGLPAARAQETTSSDQPAAANLPPDQLDSLVAPIALYPDPLLSQTLVASTYPLEVIQLQQWLGQHKDLKDQALADAVQKQDWDPSIQALAALPDVVKQLADNIKWTTDLGNALLAQEADVMAAVQRMRHKAQAAGNLKSTDQAKVETQTVEDKQVIVIESTNPEVVYVPSYNPSYVYGAGVYPYPPIAYPPYYAGGLLLSFGVGVAMGAFWGGGYGWNAGWGGNNININNNNNFVRNSDRNQVGGGDRGNGNRGNGNVGNGNRGNSNWQHNPKHRGGAPYSNSNLASKYGGNTAAGARQTRPSQGQLGQSGGNRGGLSGANPGGGFSGANPGGGFSGANPGGGFQGGGDRVGNRQVPNGPSARNQGAFSGAGNRSSGGAARASSSRGSSSMRGGGGGSRGGSRGGRGR